VEVLVSEKGQTQKPEDAARTDAEMRAACEQLVHVLATEPPCTRPCSPKHRTVADSCECAEQAAALRALLARVDAAEARAKELDQIFDASWAADMKGVEMWRLANPGRDLVLPSRFKLVTWLLDQLKAEKLLAERLKIEVDGAIARADRAEARMEQRDEKGRELSAFLAGARSMRACIEVAAREAARKEEERILALSTAPNQGSKP
jgi:hypothetical protein